MPQYVAVSRERHGKKKWLRRANFSFAAGDVVAPIVGAELAMAALSMPCAFLQQSERYGLVALLSLVAGRNMFVAPDGRWLGRYTPAVFRLYPFAALPRQGTDTLVFCADEESKLIIDASSTGEDFFDAQGNLAPALSPLLEAATALQRNRKSTDLAVAALAQAGVLRPWEIKVKSPIGERPISGLYRADEAALRALPDETFLNLRRTALPIAYMQMLSMGQLGIFEQLEKLSTQPSSPSFAALPETLDGLLENLKDTL